MIRTIGFAVLGTALFATATMAQRGAGLSEACRNEIVALCKPSPDGARGQMRQCLREKRDQLSDGCKGELRERMLQRRGGQAKEPQAGGTPLSYGPHDRQQLDLWPAATGKVPAPVILFIHGGGWQFGDKRQGAGTKPAFYNGLGWAFASTNYRLVPAVTPAEQAADIAAAIAKLRADSKALGVDPWRIVVMGHSAGAHLAALVAADPRYLASAGVPARAIRGVILLDGAGYDVATQIGSGGPIVGRLYLPAFSQDKAVQHRLSPVFHAAAPNAERWLILHAGRRDAARIQGEGLAAALRSAGTRAEVVAVADGTHSSINRDAGSSGTVVANAISGFLAGLS